MSRIVIIEDSPTQGQLLQALLEREGYQTTLAMNGEEGLAVIHGTAPDLVITDIRMPGINGYELCWRLKNTPATRAIPVILLSGLAELVDIVLGLESLADSYIIKPFEEAEVLQQVELLLSLEGDPPPPEEERPLGVQVEGDAFTIRSSRRQILNFLLSTYDSLIRRNLRLQEIQTQLRVANEQLLERSRELEVSETRFRSLVQTAPDIIYRIDPDGIFRFVNHSVRKLGYEPEELIGRHFSEIIAPDNLDRISRSQVLPRLSGQITGDAGAPRLFDEKRTGNRKTTGLEVLLRTKGGQDNPRHGHLLPLQEEMLVVEVNSAGMYQVNPETATGQFIGTVGVIRDITDRRKVAEELRLAKEQAVSANLAKSEFLSRMSHELRTPMNAILGFGQLLVSDQEDPLTASQTEQMEEILLAGRHLLELINEILDLARIEAGKVALNPEVVAPDPILTSCLKVAQVLAERRRVTLLDRRQGGAPPPLWVDAVRFKQILLNLLSNAIKYNREGGEVTLTTSQTGGTLFRIGITDTGPGIPPERQAEIFQPFSRLGAEEGAEEGTGIGLTITRQLAELMGGRVEFQSEPGKGSTFWVLLPIAPRGEEPPDPEKVPPYLDLGSSLEPGPHRRLVLYVEDDPSNLRLMQRIVERFPGVDMLHAHTAEIGLELAVAKQPDLIFMDIHLPGMNGVEALRRLRSLEETRHIPVVALTANVMSDHLDAGREAGFDNFQVKPMDINEILSVLQEFLHVAP